MFDTHCHLQFGAFEGREEEILNRAKEVGMTHMMLPSTDVTTSRKAIEMVRRHSGKRQRIQNRSWTSQDDIELVAAVGIHPHHIYQYQISPLRQGFEGQANIKEKLKNDLREIEKLLKSKEVIAVGEIGVDRYYYKDTKYTDYRITEEFVAIQREVLKQQLRFVFKYNKSLILHNRNAKRDLLEMLRELRVNELTSLAGKTVFHCCEPDLELLNYAKEHGFYLGVDGDVTYSLEKQEFIKKVPLEMLVLETDSPFLTPEPIRSQLDAKKRRPKNEPKNLRIIAEYIGHLRGVPAGQVIDQTTQNAKKLFKI